jgi:tRNA (adenine57-N1/adenine58-N1)-methyltransferase catalytic subunit
VPAWLELRLGDVREIEGTGEIFHRVVLDLPEPWTVLPAVGQALAPGGVLCGYLPTTGQVQSLALALEDAGYVELQTLEVLVRTWHVAARSVRPDHRMVAHTGFLTVARRAAGRSP